MARRAVQFFEPRVRRPEAVSEMSVSEGEAVTEWVGLLAEEMQSRAQQSVCVVDARCRVEPEQAAGSFPRPTASVELS